MEGLGIESFPMLSFSAVAAVESPQVVFVIWYSFLMILLRQCEQVSFARGHFVIIDMRFWLFLNQFDIHVND